MTKVLEATIKALNLTDYQVKLTSTPFKVMNKAQKVEALELGDKLFAYDMVLKEEARKTEVQVPYWEQTDGVQQVRKFY